MNGEQIHLFFVQSLEFMKEALHSPSSLQNVTKESEEKKQNDEKKIQM